MAYLIDGNNFIGHTSPYELRDPRNRYSLIAKLLIFNKIEKVKIIVAFDGQPDPEISDQNFPSRALTVLYPDRGHSADGVIKDIISKRARERRFYVVSSDREIKDYARTNGIKSLSCEEFNKRLKDALKENKTLKEMDKETRLPSPLETNHWIDIFKKKR
jgi:predicted RNA-binding protein with PIN domain